MFWWSDGRWTDSLTAQCSGGPTDGDIVWRSARLPRAQSTCSLHPHYFPRRLATMHLFLLPQFLFYISSYLHFILFSFYWPSCPFLLLSFTRSCIFITIVLLFLPPSLIFNYLSFCPFNPLNAELNPICHLLALVGAHHILHVSSIRVKCVFFSLHHFLCSALSPSTVPISQVPPLSNHPAPFISIIP